MDRRDAKYYEAHAQTIILDSITSSYDNARILRRLRRNDPTFTALGIMNSDNHYTDEDDYLVDRGDDLGWLGYYVGNSDTLESLYIESSPATIGVHQFGAFIEGLNKNQSIQVLSILADLGSCFRQMSVFFSSNHNLTELFFGNMDAIGIESARSIAFMLSQPGKSKLRNISFEESNASEEVLAEIATAISTHSQLEVLNLGENNLGRDGSVALGNALKACNNPRLQKLLLWNNSIDDEGLRALVAGMRNCHNLTELDLACNESITVDGFRLLSTLFQSEHCHLKHLDLSSMNVENDRARAIATGLASLNSLERLHLSDNAIGGDGARALGAGLVNLRSLEKLYLEDNSIGDVGASALVAGLSSLQSLETLHLSANSMGKTGATAIGAGMKSLQSLKTLLLYNNSIGDYGSIALAAGLVNLHSLEKMDLEGNSIGDRGVQALVEGLVNCVNLKHLDLSSNGTITASGLRSLSTLLHSERCSLSDISLQDIPFGDDGAVALSDALKSNKSMKQLNFDPDSVRLTPVGWSAFSKLLCDTSSVNATYHSNHYLTTIGNWSNEDAPEEVNQLLALNKHDDKHVTIHKILKSHSDFDIEPFFEWKLKLLPLVISWFERVITLVDVNDHKWISDESAEEIQSRQLSTMYNFVRGMPLLAVDGYRSRNNAAVLSPSRKRKIEQLQLADES